MLERWWCKMAVGWRHCLALLCTLMLAGCAPVPVKPDQAAKLSAGMPVAEVDKVLGRASLKSAYGFEQDGKRYTVREYSMQTGVETMWKSYYRPCTNPPYCPGEVPYAMPQVEPYMVVLEDETLLAWGTPQELFRSQDSAVEAIKLGFSGLRRPASVMGGSVAPARSKVSSLHP